MAIDGDPADVVDGDRNRGRARNDEKTGSCERGIPGSSARYTCVLARERGPRNKLEQTARPWDVACEWRQREKVDGSDRRGGQGWNMKQNADSRKDRACSAKSQRPSRAA